MADREKFEYQTDNQKEVWGSTSLSCINVGHKFHVPAYVAEIDGVSSPKQAQMVQAVFKEAGFKRFANATYNSEDGTLSLQFKQKDKAALEEFAHKCLGLEGLPALPLEASRKTFGKHTEALNPKAQKSEDALQEEAKGKKPMHKQVQEQFKFDKRNGGLSRG